MTKKAQKAAKRQKPVAVTDRSTLSKNQRAELGKHEETIAEGLGTFFDVGIALAQIRDKELYKEHYASFEEYCEARWNFRRHYANRLIKAAIVTQTLKEEGGFSALPVNEFQARALSGIGKNRLVEGWQAVLERSGKELPRGDEIQQVVQQYRQDQRRKRSAAKKRPKKSVEPPSVKGVATTLNRLERQFRALTVRRSVRSSELNPLLEELNRAKKSLRQIARQR